jgi:hypothetical protein
MSREENVKVEKRFHIENGFFYFSIPGKVLFHFSSFQSHYSVVKLSATLDKLQHRGGVGVPT